LLSFSTQLASLLSWLLLFTFRDIGGGGEILKVVEQLADGSYPQPENHLAVYLIWLIGLHLCLTE
jgi:hypothetical protein